jgi:hypothetical protein
VGDIKSTRTVINALKKCCFLNSDTWFQGIPVNTSQKNKNKKISIYKNSLKKLSVGVTKIKTYIHFKKKKKAKSILKNCLLSQKNLNKNKKSIQF